MAFIGRQSELSMLEKHYRSSKSELFVLYGRRRVGKTALLREFCTGKPSIYYMAAQTESQDNLTQFVFQCQQTLNDPQIEHIAFKTIEGILQHLTKRDLQQKLVIVIDEFQYWVNADLSIPSLLQRFWDQIGQHANVMLVLCGSSISLMVDYALAEKSPLYGRRTGQMQVKPFDYRTAALFFPGWSYQDKLLAYGILGGIPAYLKQFNPALPLKENVIQQILQKDTFLNEEPEFLLKTELRDISSYTSILKVISAGNTALKDITSKVNHTATSISSYLSNLQILHLVSREVSLLESAPEKSKKGRYRIQDNFLNFWFRFAQPSLTFIELNEGEQLYRQLVEPQLNTYMGLIFETICQQYLLYYGREADLPIPSQVGRIWGKDFDIDVVAKHLDHSWTFGECKWSNAPVDQGLYYLLQERARKTKLMTDKDHFVLFSSGGFHSGNLANHPIKLITPDKLFGD